MAEITKYSVYLNEQQEYKLRLLSATTGRDPEQIINESLYSYLLIADPFAEDKEPPQNQTEILFYIPDDKAATLDKLAQLEGIADRDEYAKQLLLLHIG